MVVKYHDILTDRRASRIFVGRVAHSISLEQFEILHKAAIGVRANGTIAFLEPEFASDRELRARHAADGFEDAHIQHMTPSQFLLPGLIDTHLHAPQWPNLALGMEGNLREWVEEWTDPIEASYNDNEKARQVYEDVVRTTLRLGSTTVAYNSSLHTGATNILAETCFKAGQRAIVGKMCVTVGSTHGNWEADSASSVAESAKCIQFVKQLDPDGQLVRPCVQPRGGPYCPPDLMKALGRQREETTAYVQLHMCETESDTQRTLQLHKNFDCYSDMYRSYGLLNEKSIVAHCIHLTSRDYKNLVVSRAGVAHNPNSNTCLRDGECRVRDLLDMDVKVALGSDCSAGYMPSIHSAIRSASNVSRHLAVKEQNDRYILSFGELMYLATVGGARVVDLEHKIGNFKPGKQFDALFIDVEGMIGMDSSILDRGSQYDESIIKKFIYLGDDRQILKVFVGGRLVAGRVMM